MPASYFLMTIMQTNYKSKLFKDDLNVILNKNTIKKTSPSVAILIFRFLH